MKTYFIRPYLGCFKVNLLYELLEKNYPVNYFFYNAIQDTRDVYKETFINDVGFWGYNNKLFNTLEFAGINYSEEQFNNFEAARSYIESMINNGTTLYMYVTNKNFSHLIRNDFSPEGSHVITLKKYNKQTKQFVVGDVPLLYETTYDEEVISYNFDNLPEDKRILFHVDYSRYKFDNHTLDYIQNEFKQMVLNNNDDFSLYDQIIKSASNSKSIDSASSIENALAIITMSKFYLEKYLISTRFSEKVISLVQEASDQADSLRKMVIKQRLGGNIDINKFISKCQILKLNEIETIDLLRKEVNCSNRFLNPVNNRINTTDFKPKILKKTDSSITVEWGHPHEDVYVLLYQIYCNGIQIGTSILPKFELLNLQDSTNYKISIAAQDVSGRIINSKEEVYVRTCSKDLAKNKVVMASSEENCDLAKECVVDGNPNTRWSSKHESDPEWICIDLGEEHAVQSVNIHWDTAYASKYIIQCSNDNITWVDVCQNDNGHGGIETVSNLLIECRYFRILGLERATPWGYSIWNINLFN